MTVASQKTQFSWDWDARIDVLPYQVRYIAQEECFKTIQHTESLIQTIP